MKRLSLVVLLCALAVPAVADAKGGAVHKSATKQCKALRTEMGAEAFRAAFGKQGKRAMKRCVAAQKKATRRARKSCKAEGKRGRALKRCVRAKLAADPPAALPTAVKEALAVCNEARAEDPQGFAEEYGDGPEAIEACVAVQTDEPDEEGSEEGEPVEEEPDDGEATDGPDLESEPV